MVNGPVDSRVVAIAPIVMDLLNFEAGLLHMFRSYGNWTFAFEPYWKENITQAIVGNPDGLKALGVVLDPLNYKEWLRVPKLVVDATGDEFFMPDDDWFWWKDMSDGSAGEIYRLMVDNAEHSFATGVYELVTGVAPFYQSILRGTPRPKFYWTLNHDEGTIDLVSDLQTLCESSCARRLQPIIDAGTSGSLKAILKLTRAHLFLSKFLESHA